MNIYTFSTPEFKKYLKTKQIYFEYYQTIAGLILISFTDDGIFEAKFVNENQIDFNIKINNHQNKNLILYGTEFQIKVWQTILQIPKNQKSSYQELAIKIDKPKAHRAVANALAQNKIAYFIPCHKIINKNGNLRGYKWGSKIKKKLLFYESNNKKQ